MLLQNPCSICILWHNLWSYVVSDMATIWSCSTQVPSSDYVSDLITLWSVEYASGNLSFW